MALTTTAALPLTTVFTPPAGCLSTWTYNQHAIWAPNYTGKDNLSPAVLLGATGQAPDLLCYPPKFTQRNLYSPGICPSGWSSACEARSSWSGSSAPSGSGTTVQCCPTGLTCSGNNWCRGQPPPSDVPVWSVFTDKWGMEGFLTTSRIDTLSVLAKPIFVAHQSSDQDLLQSAQAAARETTGQNVGSNSTSGTTSLSGGAIAGIAIGSAFGGILLATLATFVALRFCFGYRKLRQDAQYDNLDEQEKRRTAGINARELDASNHYNELQAESRAELPVPLKELGSETGSYIK